MLIGYYCMVSIATAMATNGIVQEQENIEDTKGECVCVCVCVCIKITMKVCDGCVPTHALSNTYHPIQKFLHSCTALWSSCE